MIHNALTLSVIPQSQHLSWYILVYYMVYKFDVSLYKETICIRLRQGVIFQILEDSGYSANEGPGQIANEDESLLGNEAEPPRYKDAATQYDPPERKTRSITTQTIGIQSKGSRSNQRSKGRNEFESMEKQIFFY